MLSALVLDMPTWAQEDHSLAGPRLGQLDRHASVQEAAWEWWPVDVIFRSGMQQRDEWVRDGAGG